MGGRFLLQIPAEAPYVGAARIFVGTVARRHGLDEDQVEDLKLVVSEACGAAVRGGEDGEIRLTFEATETGAVLQVLGGPEPEGAAVDGEPTPTSFARSVGYDVIRSIYPDAHIGAADDSGLVRVEVPAPGKEPVDGEP